MASDGNRLTIIAAGALASVILIGALYGLARHVPFLTRAVPEPRGAAGAGAASGRATVAGVVTRWDGAPQQARVALVRAAENVRAVPQARGRGTGSLSTTSGPDGRFALHNVPAGSFWLVAHAEVVGEAPALPAHLWAIHDVSSNGRTATDVTLSLEPGGTITGLLEFKSFEGTARPDMSATTLVLSPAEARTQAQLVSGPPHARPDGSGAFVIAAIAPGQYTLDASTPSGWSLDSATLDGHDWLDHPFDVTSRWGIRRATLVFSDRPNAVTGLVRQASGRPASFSLVMAFSGEPSLRQAPRRVQAARADAEGRFTLSGLPTGGYLVAPAADLLPERWYTPESFVELTPRAVPVSVGHGETKTVNLQIR